MADGSKLNSNVVSLFKETVDAGGRDGELSVLLREHEESQRSRARFVFVRGPAGVGKSHLFHLLRHKLAARGVPVFEAESPREASRPFGLFAQMLDALVEHCGHAGVPQAVLAKLTRSLAPLLAEVSSKVPSAPAGPVEENRLALYDAACELFTLAGRSSPVFLFPDLDAADKASLELFRYLAAVVTAPESRANGLFVGSFRDDGAMPSALTEVVAKVSARSLPLAGLDAEGIRAWLSRADVAEKLLQATGGNPDAIEQLLQRPVGKPAELFLKRAEALTAAQKKVLTALAASRDALAQDVLTGALARLSLSPEAALVELDALVRAHLVAVRVVGGAPVYRFNREAEKQAFAESVSEKLAGARKAVGDELLARGDAPLAAELLGDAKTYLAAADQLAARGAHEDAADFYERALPGLARDAQGKAHRQLSAVALAMGDFRRAARNVLRARSLGGVSDGEAALSSARLLIKMGRLLLARTAVGPALKDPATRNAATAVLAEVKLLKGDAEGALALARAELPRLDAAPEAAVALRNVLGKALLMKGELAQAEEAFAMNAELAQANGLPNLATLAQVNRGVAAHRKGERERAMGFYQAGLSGQRPMQAQALANLGSIYADAGDFELALDHLSRALQAFSRFMSYREAAQVASNLSRLVHFLGDLDRAIELSEHALKLSRDIGEKYLTASALLNVGAALVDKRELLEAARLLDEARARFEEVGSDGYASLASALKARCHLAGGERAQASAELSRRVHEKGTAQLPAAMVEVELARADLCLLLGDLHGAGRAANRAREALLSRPDLEGPYRVYFTMGKLRQAAGDSAGAQAEMARAARLLDEVTQRVPPARRTAFLSVPRRAELLAAVEPELRLPRLASQAPADARGPHGLVGGSGALAKVIRQIDPIGRSNATVLIRGESGTGKELLAEAIHNASSRKGMPLVKVNCAAMVEELLLSELFGHEKGAFTGAIRERKGRFELADGGTLFLDEIGDISPKCQVALLRVLQEREFERVGGTKTLKVDVRVICATNRDLETLIAQGRFRQDLYYRLKGVMLELPALRERPEDLPMLAQHFLNRVSRERNEPVKQLSQESLDLIRRHAWPGNVRELENVLASAAIFAEGTLITPEAFSHVAELAALAGDSPLPRRGEGQGEGPATPPPSIETRAFDEGDDDDGDDDGPPSRPPAPPPPGGTLDYYGIARDRGMSLRDLRHEIEMQCIKRALLDAKGNISEAARLLKMKRSRLSQIVNAEAELREVAHAD